MKSNFDRSFMFKYNNICIDLWVIIVILCTEIDLCNVLSYIDCDLCVSIMNIYSQHLFYGVSCLFYNHIIQNIIL